MRVVAEIPHPRFNITIMSWNAKYILRIMIDEYEQTFRIKEEDVDGLEQVKAIVDQDFLDQCMQRFLTMRSDFVSAFKRVTAE